MGSDQDTQLLVKIASDVAETREKVGALEARHTLLANRVGEISADVKGLVAESNQAKGAAGAHDHHTTEFRAVAGLVLSVVGAGCGVGWLLVGGLHLIG